jgi:hypothetical protein
VLNVTLTFFGTFGVTLIVDWTEHPIPSVPEQDRLNVLFGPGGSFSYRIVNVAVCPLVFTNFVPLDWLSGVTDTLANLAVGPSTDATLAVAGARSVRSLAGGLRAALDVNATSTIEATTTISRTAPDPMSAPPVPVTVNEGAQVHDVCRWAG